MRRTDELLPGNPWLRRLRDGNGATRVICFPMQAVPPVTSGDWPRCCRSTPKCSPCNIRDGEIDCASGR